MKKEDQKIIGRMQQGVGLVEVLVALLVFSVGMLGVASLQVISRKSSFEAQQRQEAVLLASEMVALIKSRSNGQTFTEIKAAYSANDWEITSKLDPPSKACDSPPYGCTLTEKAEWDQHLWSKSIVAAAVSESAQGLVGAKGCVLFGTVADPTDLVVRVVVAWKSMTGMGSATGVGCNITDAGNKQRHVMIRTYI